MKNIHLVIFIVLFILLKPFILYSQWKKTNGPNVGYINKIVYLNNNIFVATYNGIYFTSNSGFNWSQRSDGMVNKNINTLYSHNNILYSGTFSDSFPNGNAFLYKSTNFGENWSVIAVFPNNNFFDIIVGDDYIFTATLDSVNGGIYRSLVNNFNFTRLYTGSTSNIIRNGPILFSAKWLGGVYKSTNTGNNWLISGLENYKTRSLLFKENYVFAGTENNGIYRSSDFGLTWQKKMNISINNVTRSMIKYGNYVFAGIYFYGIFKSSNNGDNWISVNYGLSNAYITDICIGDTIMYAAQESYIWTRNISEMVVNINTQNELIKDYFLFQNYPNPFNPMTYIRYEIIKSNDVLIKVYDILGKEIAILVNEKQSPGTYEVTFDASKYPSGVYFYRLETEGFADTKKMILLK